MISREELIQKERDIRSLELELESKKADLHREKEELIRYELANNKSKFEILADAIRRKHKGDVDHYLASQKLSGGVNFTITDSEGRTTSDEVREPMDHSLMDMMLDWYRENLDKYENLRVSPYNTFKYNPNTLEIDIETSDEFWKRSSDERHLLMIKLLGGEEDKKETKWKMAQTRYRINGGKFEDVFGITKEVIDHLMSSFYDKHTQENDLVVISHSEIQFGIDERFSGGGGSPTLKIYYKIATLNKD